MSQPELDWSPELIEWVYGPPGEEGDEPPSTGEIYAIQEEEERVRWLPGYRELLERYFRARESWHAQYIPGEPYPAEPEEHRELVAKIGTERLKRARPPWEPSDAEKAPW